MVCSGLRFEVFWNIIYLFAIYSSRAFCLLCVCGCFPLLYTGFHISGSLCNEPQQVQGV